MTNDPLFEKLTSPISQASPTGDDPKYNNEYDLVKNEVAKTSERDFEMVAMHAHTILTQQAKDITILGFGMLAHSALNKWKECAIYAHAYIWFLQNHGESIHPQRERARINALKWLNEDRVVGLFSQTEANPSDHEYLSALIEALKQIQQWVYTAFPSETFSIKSLIQAMELKHQSIKPNEPAQTPPVVHPPEPKPSTAEPQPTPPPKEPSLSLENASRSDLQKQIQLIALQLSSREPEKALGYVLLRVNRWQDQIMLPKSDNQGKTPFQGPIKQRRDYFETLYSQGSFETILEKCEPVFTEPGMQFWFDLQFYVVNALRRLNRTPVADAIENELKALIARVPQIFGLLFADGTPLANPTTLEWIQSLGTSANSSNAPTPQSKSNKNVDLQEDLEQVEALGAAGKWAEALALLHNGVLHGSLQERTEREYAIAHTALKATKYRISWHYAQILIQRLEEQSLEKWDPKLALQIWKIAYHSSKSILQSEPKATDASPIQSLQALAYSKICFLDPSYAAQQF